MSGQALDCWCHGVSVSYLVIRNGSSYVLNEAVQSIDMVAVIEELQKSTLFGERPKFRDNAR